MKNIHKITSGAILLLIALLNFSCTSDEKQLINGVWTFSEYEHDCENQTTAAFLALGEALLEDATMEFQESGDYILTSPLVDNPDLGTWVLEGEDKLILTPDGGDESETTILELTKTSLKYSEIGVDLTLDTYTATTTWIRE